MTSPHGKIIELSQKKKMDLQDSVSENQILRSSCRDFPQFNSLPPELRRKIWLYACLEPVVHLLEYGWMERLLRGSVNRSRGASAVIKTCKEARVTAISLQQFYFGGLVLTGKISGKNYISPTTDTIWLYGFRGKFDGCSHDLALAALPYWYCGKCKTRYRRIGLQDTICGGDCHGKRGDLGELGGQVLLNRFAINAEHWVEPNLGSDYRIHDTLGTLATVYLHGIQEVLIVVEEIGDMIHENDLVFTAPSCEERRQEALRAAGGMFEEIGVKGLNWADSENILNKTMAEFPQTHTLVRKQALDRGVVTLEDIERDIKQRNLPGLIDLAGWNMPRFRFVEARKGKDVRFLSPGIEII